jgi:pimeloyl-ACP methyl ester carboxylesterase
VLNIPHPALFLRRLFRWPQIARSWYIFFFQLPWLPEWLLGRQHARPIAEAIRRTAADRSRFPDAVLDEYRRNASQPGALTAMINYYRALFQRWPTAEQQRAMRRILDVPTLMIWGEKDTALGKELTYGTDKLVRPFALHYLPAVSHWIQQEAPEQVNAIIEQWLTQAAVQNLRANPV